VNKSAQQEIMADCALKMSLGPQVKV